MDFQPRDPSFEAKVLASFQKQQAMHSLSGKVAQVKPGEVILEMPFNPDFTQQHGFMHAGIITTMLDSAAGYAAFSLMEPEAAVLTIELKTNLMAPAKGEQFRFVGTVVKPGRTITFCEANAFAINTDKPDTKIASMTATMMSVVGRDDVKE